MNMTTMRPWFVDPFLWQKVGRLFTPPGPLTKEMTSKRGRNIYQVIQSDLYWRSLNYSIWKGHLTTLKKGLKELPGSFFFEISCLPKQQKQWNVFPMGFHPPQKKELLQLEAKTTVENKWDPVGGSSQLVSD